MPSLFLLRMKERQCTHQTGLGQVEVLLFDYAIHLWGKKSLKWNYGIDLYK